MKRISWLLVVPLALAAVASAPVGCVEGNTYLLDPTGGAGGTGGSSSNSGGGGMMGSSSGMGGNANECIGAADCAVKECQTSACVDGTCQWTLIPKDTNAQSQLYGDCRDRICDGNGMAVDTEGGKDTYDWGNPCYKDGCNAWTKMPPDPDNDKDCTTDLGGAGICLALKCVDCIPGKKECTGGRTCVDNRCIVMTCQNAVQDVGETDLNCGGPCAPCGVGKKCVSETDCEGKGACTEEAASGAGGAGGGANKVCSAPTCSDKIKNGNETGIDCGGDCSTKDPPQLCGDSQDCLLPSDCVSGVCSNGTCQAPLCIDFTKNGTETGLDCGGSCSPCP